MWTAWGEQGEVYNIIRFSISEYYGCCGASVLHSGSVGKERFNQSDVNYYLREGMLKIFSSEEEACKAAIEYILTYSSSIITVADKKNGQLIALVEKLAAVDSRMKPELVSEWVNHNTKRKLGLWVIHNPREGDEEDEEDDE